MKTKRLKPKKITIILMIIFVIALLFGIGYGSYVIINKKNYNDKVRKINNKLSANLKIIEEKNKEYINELELEENEWKIKLEELNNNETQVAEEVKNMSFVGIGDSVFLDTISDLKGYFNNGYYDAKISRPLVTGVDILNKLKNQGKLADTIILGLANNGFFSENTSKKLMDVVENRTVYWINTVGPDDPDFNVKFSEFAKNYPNIHIIDWVETSKGHNEYFYPDGTHIKGPGVKAYAKMIYDAVYKDYLNKYNTEKEELIKKHNEEKKNKVTFYGNELLISSADKIREKYPNIMINTKKNYDFEKVYNDIKEKLEKNELEKKIVLMFDKKDNVSISEYQRLIELCNEYEIYICDISGKSLAFTNQNVKVIDCYDKIKMNKDYLEFDDIHLSDKGVNILIEILSQNIEL